MIAIELGAINGLSLDILAAWKEVCKFVLACEMRPGFLLDKHQDYCAAGYSVSGDGAERYRFEILGESGDIKSIPLRTVGPT